MIGYLSQANISSAYFIHAEYNNCYAKKKNKMLYLTLKLFVYYFDHFSIRYEPCRKKKKK